MEYQASDKASRLEHLARLCRERGLALTVQRRIILETVLDRDDHPTADQVYDDVQLRIPGVSRTTVYRVLDTLVRLGVLARPCTPGAVQRFDPGTHRHHHLVCTRCDRVSDLDDEQFNAIQFPDVDASEFKIEDYSIHFRGICRACCDSESGTTP